MRSRLGVGRLSSSQISATPHDWHQRALIHGSSPFIDGSGACDWARKTLPAPPAYLGRVTARRIYTGGERRWRLALTLILAGYGWLLLRTPGQYRWLDSLDLAIHEAGHLMFALGGEFAGLLGGTLLQLLVPLTFVLALRRQADPHGATVPLWWLGRTASTSRSI
jgi:hypothetical protein